MPASLTPRLGSSSFSPCGRRWREAPDEGSLSARNAWRHTPHPSELASTDIAALSHKGRGHINGRLACSRSRAKSNISAAAPSSAS
ncbi:hypothetical protein EGT07_27335 [Herbaspirillum sp. HC18]|nr:hypothetical protein EGT07_27335 [Herbaspirillum sp. HC18]